MSKTHKARIEARAQARGDSEPEAAPQGRSEIRSEIKSEARPETKPVGRTNGKAEPTLEAKPDAAVIKPRREARETARDGGNDWSEVANFVVTFERRGSPAAGNIERRITAHKMQEGGISARWSGVAQPPMVAWMVEQAGDEWGADAAPDTMDQGSSAAAPETVALSIQDFRVQAKEGSAAFDLEASIEVQGIARADASVMPPCTVSFYSRNVLTKDKAALGSVVLDELEPGRKSYRARLAAVKLPAGEYRLESIALIGGRLPKVAHKSGLALHVR